MAERVGFEPTAPCGVTGFQDQLLKPLGHLSMVEVVGVEPTYRTLHFGLNALSKPFHPLMVDHQGLEPWVSRL